MTTTAPLSLENPAYVTGIKNRWLTPPLSIRVIEYCGAGDPMFGGNADDRSLNVTGRISDRHSREEEAVFLTIEAAHEAAKLIPNRRPNSVLGAAPSWNA